MIEQELFDTSPYGRFYIPTEVVHFLVALTGPRPGEHVLGIGLFDPAVLNAALETRAEVRSTHIKGYLAREELDELYEQYSVILCAPPFSFPIDRGLSRPNEPSEEFWLRWSIRHLAEDGRLAIIVPTGLLSNYSQEPIRRFLLEESGLQAVVELPAGWAAATLTQASVLFITSYRETSQPVRMFRFADAKIIPWDDLALHVTTAKPIAPREVVGEVYTVSPTKLSSFRLDAQYYDPKYTDLPIPDPATFEAIKLGDLVEMRSGQRFSEEDFEPHGIPFVQVGNVTLDGRLNLRDARTITPSKAVTSRSHSQPGDILITIAGTVGKVASLGPETPAAGVCMDTSLRRLRVTNPEYVLSEYLALYLRSRLAQLQIERFVSGSVISTLSSPNLREVKVFLPDLDVQREIVVAFHRLSEQHFEGLLSAFPDVEQMRILAETAQSEKVQAAEQMALPLTAHEPLSWQTIWRDRFPFPIARAYTVFASKASDLPSIRLKALIDVSESVVYYLYGILAADQLRHLRISDEDRRSTIVTDYSIDQRIGFIFHALKHARADDNIALFVPELADAEVGVCRDIHRNLRNRYSHLAAQPEPWCEQQVSKYEPKLEGLLQSLEALQNYKLVQIPNVVFRGGQFQHSVILMMGSPDVFPPDTIELDEPLRADAQHVILIDQEDFNLLDLHPFYVMYAWEHTGMHPHLCFFKQVRGDPPNQRLLVESTKGVGDTETETDLGLSDLLATGIM